MKLLIRHTHTPHVNLKLLFLAVFYNFLKKFKIFVGGGGVGGRKKSKGINKFKTTPADTYTKQSVKRKMAKGNAV